MSAVRDQVKAGSLPTDLLFKEIVARLDGQEKRQEQLLASMRKAIAAMPSPASAPEAPAQETAVPRPPQPLPSMEPMLLEILERLQDQDSTLARRDEQVNESVRTELATTRPVLERIAAILEAQDQQQRQLLAGVQAAIAAGAAEQQPLLQQIAAKIEAQTAETGSRPDRHARSRGNPTVRGAGDAPTGRRPT